MTKVRIFASNCSGTLGKVYVTNKLAQWIYLIGLIWSHSGTLKSAHHWRADGLDSALSGGDLFARWRQIVQEVTAVSLAVEKLLGYPYVAPPALWASLCSRGIL